MSDDSSKYSGSCLCGRVKYAFGVEPRVLVACHCSLCRKATGSAFGTFALVPKEHFKWTAGGDRVATFSSSSEAQRLFCRECGSTLGSLHDQRPMFMHVAAGTLDSAPSMHLAMHAYTGSKAAWYEILDSLPQHQAAPGKR
jgi:hypothetical protein